MRNWVWAVVVGVITLFVLRVMKELSLPPALVFVFLLPLLAVMFVYISFIYSFRISLQPEPIPASLQARVHILEKEAPAIETLGFHKLDAFYLKMIPDAVVSVFKHNAEPTYLCAYHLGSKRSCDLVTFFEGDLTLTTCSDVNGGMAPRPSKRLLQIFENRSYERMLQGHNEAVQFIRKMGVRPTDRIVGAFRETFMKSIREFSEHVRALPFWPIRLIYWTVTKHGKIYLRSIEEQYQRGMISLSS